MKKPYTKPLVIIVLCLLLIPQLAFAAWWNPSTWFKNWNFLRKKEDKTQILENRVKELEKKLEDTPAVFTPTDIPPSSAQSTSKTTSKSAIKQNDTFASGSKSEIVPKPLVKTEDDSWRGSLRQMNDSLILSYKDSIRNSTDFGMELSARLAKNQTAKYFLDSMVVESVPVGVNVPNDLWRALSKIVANESDLINLWISINNKNISSFNTGLTLLEGDRNNIYKSGYTKQQGTETIKEGTKLYEFVAKQVNETQRKFSDITVDNDSMLKNGIQALQKNIDDYNYKTYSNYINSRAYSYQSIPSLKLPTTTFCQALPFGGGGYTISCY
jgi:hypothetical protein